MGVLEEAIRDHLELKRRHGASDEEVEQEEAEALGPARRGFEGTEEEAPEEEGVEEEAAEEAAPLPDQSTQVHEQLPAEPALEEPEPLSEPEPEPEPDLEFEREPEPQGDTLLPETPDFIEDAPEGDRIRSE